MCTPPRAAVAVLVLYASTLGGEHASPLQVAGYSLTLSFFFVFVRSKLKAQNMVKTAMNRGLPLHQPQKL